MKIYLINMPFSEQEYIKFSEKWDYIEDEYIGINIVHSILKSYNVDVVKSYRNSLKDMIADILATNYDVVMISVMQTSARLTHDFIMELRKKGYKNKIFIGGWFAKLSWRYIYENNWDVDYVCYVDAENVLPLWLNNPDNEILGIATRNNYQDQSKIKLEEIRNNSMWPQTYYSPAREPGRKTYRLETSRGCPHAKCTFCSLSNANMIKNKWTSLPVEIIVDEISKIHNLYGVTRFSLTDDDMLGPIESAEARAKELYNAIKQLPFKISFSGSISVKAATNETILDCLVESGLEQLGIGFESADEEQLRRYNKQQTLKENYIAAENITRRKINLIPGLITFDPFATTETIRKNLDFLFNNIRHYDLGKLTKRLYVITGTPIAKLVEKHNLLTGDYLGYDYKFMHTETERLYNDFETYTAMVRDTQILLRKKGLAYDERVGLHHKTVADRILGGYDWKQTAKEEIEKIKIMTEGNSI